MKPVKAFTLQGKFIVVILRFLLFFGYLIKGKKWLRPRRNFSEDASHYSRIDIIYFAYKYYYKPHELFEKKESGKKINTQFIPPLVSSEAPVVSITAAGDLMPYEWINDKYCKSLWDDIGDDFFGSDMVIANLETPINSNRPPGLVPEVMLNDMEFNGDESMFNIFNGNKKYKGFDILSTANNHSYDKGEEGVISTIAFLQKQNIAYCGTAASVEQRQHIPIIESNGIKIAFVAYTYSLNHLNLPPGKEYLCNHVPLNTPGCDLSFIKEQVLLAHQRGVDMVVASVHFGNAYQLFPSDHIIDTTHRLFNECGIDIILGGHAHNIQPMEYYNFICPITQRKKQGFAIYCLGDFVAYDIFTWGHLPVWLRIEIAKTSEGAVIKDIIVNPLYTCGIYKSKDERELRFFDAKKLWKRIDNGEKNILPLFNIKEATYLKTIYEKVLGCKEH
jgi:hypothetical protein